jgi:type II secretory ATPase GspE/PulE/Tfp pilus assembly ATPase PilB-like protein
MTARLIMDVTNTVSDEADPTLVWEAIVGHASKAGVSDIHLMAQQESYELAFRLDGQLHVQGKMPHEFSRRMISHVRTAAGIDIAEHRRPTEGHMRTSVEGRSTDLRISAVPTLFGLDLVVRLFDRTLTPLALTELGMMGPQLERVKEMIQRPYGLILVSGPSGCGKTTTLYAMLRRLAGMGRKIMTIEDPVEYDLPSVNQTQVNPRIGVTFASMLTAILRQDPNIIMVGEIRDEETAVTAVRAANTGHLVLATTHANRASRAVETLLSLGTHPYFVVLTMLAVIAQVLVKRVCPHCRQPLPETADLILDPMVRSFLPDGASPQLYRGTGCDKCFGTGYKGRMGLFEVFIPDDHAKQLILNRSSAVELEKAAVEARMISLEQSGKLALATGQTTMEELVGTLPMVAAKPAPPGVHALA